MGLVHKDELLFFLGMRLIFLYCNKRPLLFLWQKLFLALNCHIVVLVFLAFLMIGTSYERNVTSSKNMAANIFLTCWLKIQACGKWAPSLGCRLNTEDSEKTISLSNLIQKQLCEEQQQSDNTCKYFTVVSLYKKYTSSVFYGYIMVVQWST